MNKLLEMVATIAMMTLMLSSGVVTAAAPMMVDNSWIREAPPGAMVMAGYMTIHNPTDQARQLVAAESPAFEKVMLHRTVMEGTLSKMVHQHMITIPANGMMSFEPNGYHLMMMQPKQPLKAGDRIAVTLRFKNGDSQNIEYVVRAGMEAMEAMEAMGGMKHGAEGHGH